jgi:hypothetical protein
MSYTQHTRESHTRESHVIHNTTQTPAQSAGLAAVACQEAIASELPECPLPWCLSVPRRAGDQSASVSAPLAATTRDPVSKCVFGICPSSGALSHVPSTTCMFMRDVGQHLALREVAIVQAMAL